MLLNILYICLNNLRYESPALVNKYKQWRGHLKFWTELYFVTSGRFYYYPMVTAEYMLSFLILLLSSDWCVRISSIPPWLVWRSLTADLSHDLSLSSHWPGPSHHPPIGWQIHPVPGWLRSFGVGYSAVRSPCYLPDSLLDFLSPKHTFTTFWCIFRRQNGDSVKHFIDTNPWTSREMHFFTDFCLL